MKKEKYDVLLLDDEYLVRELLKRSINWDGLSLNLAAEASSGMEALEICAEMKPEIVFADICMPNMDGIEFSRKLLEICPKTKIIILTGHDEFHYAKDCISLGIKEYLLKPINETEIQTVLLQVISEINSDEASLQEINALKEQIKQSFPYLRERCFNELMLYPFNRNEIEEKLKYYNVEFNHSYFQLALLSAQESASESKQGEEKDLLLVMAALDWLKNADNGDRSLLFFQGPRNNIVLLNSNVNVDFYGLCQEKLAELKNRLNCDITIGMAEPKKALEELSIAYDEASLALRYRAIEGVNGIIAYGELDFTNVQNESPFHQQLEDFRFYLGAGIRDKAMNSMDEILRKHHCPENSHIEAIRVSSSYIISVLLSTIQGTGLSPQILFADDLPPYQRIYQLNTIGAIEEYLKELLSLLVDSIHSLHSEKKSQLIEKIIDYLQRNYSDENLSQSKVAEECNINSCYLSRKFKQEMNQTFMEYLSRLRIEKAIDLMKTSDKKNYEIAEEVGISDPHYFSIFFKRHMKMSISEYRKNLDSKIYESSK